MVLIEEYQRLGVNFVEALEQTSYWSEGVDTKALEESGVQAMSDDDVARQNAENLAELERAMMGVRRG